MFPFTNTLSKSGDAQLRKGCKSRGATQAAAPPLCPGLRPADWGQHLLELGADPNLPPPHAPGVTDSGLSTFLLLSLGSQTPANIEAQDSAWPPPRPVANTEGSPRPRRAARSSGVSEDRTWRYKPILDTGSRQTHRNDGA